MTHDKLAVRLAQILMRFNNGGRFSLEELASEFNVDIRTIQRDLNQRLSFMPIQKENGKYFLESFALGKLSVKDIQNFAMLSGIQELYPKLDEDFITDLLNSKVNSIFMIKNNGFEKVDYENFEIISVAILKHNILNFDYKDKNRKVKPYKLLNYQGIWYLIADEKDKLKHFTFSKIKNIRKNNETFTPKEEFLDQILNDKNIWLDDSKEAIVKLDKKAKEYFFRKNILNNFELIDEDEQSYTLKVYFSYDDELLNVVKQWIPYIKIEKPFELKEKLDSILKDYLEN
ncbi:helix-turn-helix transcriptional regulator [Campylobacter coli]|uniref:helix-turn-helix transcriptional regulator n=1 Tax=Campylobacter coli TaxID=195 RepID=UPI0011A33449|nr:YafY family protein [Campylobacter coli]HED6586716.1 YafY family transcriptional regulator [Campylobacter coli]